MVAVIGDVHGCYYTLQQLVDKIKNNYTDIEIFCVGDLVDRGAHSFEAVDFIIKEKIKFTLGNHDLMFYSFFNDPGSQMGRTWIYNGAETTLKSYEDNMDKIEKHLSVLHKAPLFIDTEDCFISHAGISKAFQDKISKDILNNPNKLKKIISADLHDLKSILWNRGEQMNLGKLQVVGHTHRKEVFFNENTNTIYIDTTAFGMNKLSAVIVERSKVLEIIHQKTFPDDSDSRWNYYL
jgi:serine/threonine protein phosphatase 1